MKQTCLSATKLQNQNKTEKYYQTKKKKDLLTKTIHYVSFLDFIFHKSLIERYWK